MACIEFNPRLNALVYAALKLFSVGFYFVTIFVFSLVHSCIFIFNHFFCILDTSAQSARNAVVASPLRIGCVAHATSSSIWRVSRAINADDNSPPANNLLWSTIGCCVRRITWKRWRVAPHQVTVSAFYIFCWVKLLKGIRLIGLVWYTKPRTILLVKKFIKLFLLRDQCNSR